MSEPERYVIRQPRLPSAGPRLHTVVRDPDGVVVQVLVETLTEQEADEVQAVLDGPAPPGG
jgi:hypothetical protein